VRRVDAVAPIAGADRLELATVDGWQAVVKRGQLAAGDAVAYVEVDAFLPVASPFEFLRPNCFRRVEGLGEGFRIRTIKLRGQLSQGLVLPLTDVLALLPAGTDTSVGADLTAALRVLKYEPPVTSLPTALAAGVFPQWLRKTDQPRIQNVFKSWYAPAASSGGTGETPMQEGDTRSRADLTYEATLKLDGTSCTAFHRDGETGVCSRNLRVKSGPDDDNVYARVGRPVAERLAALRRNLAIQGEIMGPKIGKNRERLLHHTLFVFDVFDIDAQRYLPAPERLALCEALGLTHAPVLAPAMPLRATLPTLAAILAYADRPSLAHPVAEGVVFKCIEDPGLSFKAINNRFLLECEE
jgi:RNA ligase (TIGR02306 family)